MNLRDLKYFVALADYRHFGKAAKACFVSQPSLSIQIKKLEMDLGVSLVERTSQSVLLTDIGKVVVEQARQVLEQAASLKESAKQAQDPFSGELNLGVIPTLTTYLLPYLLPELTKTESFPKLSIYLAEQQTSTLLTNLQQGKIDVALLSLPIQEENLTVVPLFTEELMLAVPDQHPLTKRKNIKKADLQSSAMLFIEESHCLYDQAVILCQQLREQTVKQFRASSLEILRYMVVSNLGVTIMPRLACKPTDGVSYLAVSATEAKRTIAMVWRTTSTKKLLLEKMVEHIRRIMAKQPGIKVLTKLANGRS